MKKIILASALFAAMGLTMTSCLKDKGFENGQYGLNGITDRPGVGFPEGAKSIAGYSVNAIATAQTINAPLVNLLADQPASQDVHVVLQLDPTIVSAYNTANGTSLAIPTASQYSINTLTVTIPAGQRFATVPIVITNASLLSLTTTYALGFKIVSVDGGYNIASNLQKVLIAISVKNAYDGIYEVVRGRVQRYNSPGVPTVGDNLNGELGAQNPDFYLFTTGANSNVMHNDATGAGIGITWAPGSGVGGVTDLTVTVDPATNTTTMTSTLPGTLVNFGGFGGYGPPAVNTYDPATRTFHLAFKWNPATTVREYEVVLRYTGER